MKQVVKPYAESPLEKKEQVATMFNNIAAKYDFLNHSLSMGIDKLWRKRLVKKIKQVKHRQVLDVATGTGDVAIAISTLNTDKIFGIDISKGMLKVGTKKIKQKKLDNRISLRLGDSENITFEDATFDVVTSAFGVRNFENLEKGLSEMKRVLQPGGLLAVLEFSKPASFPIKTIYNFYFCFLLPFWGRIISKDKSAYVYLPESVNAFPEGQKFMDILRKVGFVNVSQDRLTFGVATLYYAHKP